MMTHGCVSRLPYTGVALCLTGKLSDLSARCLATATQKQKERAQQRKRDMELIQKWRKDR